jgi:hypothetical protein
VADDFERLLCTSTSAGRGSGRARRRSAGCWRATTRPICGCSAARCFFRFTWKALGHVEPIDRSIHARDFPMLQALTFWGAVLIIVSSLVLDAVMHRLDPRIGRTASRA